MLIVVQASLAIFSSYTLSVVRAYVRGESLWSKGQKEAVYYLARYTETRAKGDYQHFQEAIDVPLGDLAARHALEAPLPDLAVARAGFLRAGNSPEDISGIIWLYRYFARLSYLRRSIALWKATDPQIIELAQIGTKIHGIYIGKNPSSNVSPDRFREKISDINLTLTPKATAFSVSLSDGSRTLAQQLIALNATTAALLILLIALHTHKLAKQRETFEAALREEKERAEVTLASIGEAVISVDADGRVDFINSVAERLIGQAQSTTLGTPIKQLFDITGHDGTPDGAASDPADGGYEGRGQPQLLVRRDGTSVPVSMLRSSLGSMTGPFGAVYVIHNRTAEEDFIAQLSWQATHDGLTGLTNRRAFEQRLESAINSLKDHPTAHGLMFIDIDQFKIINDTNGHAAGDNLLRQAASILQRELRKEDLLARMGGDEFAILIKDRDLDNVVSLAERLRQAMAATSFQWEKRNFNITVSIGAVPVTDADITLEEVLSAADVACYLAKENGRNRVEAHRTTDRELQRRFGEMGWVQKIRQAIKHNHFCLYAQEIRAISRESNNPHIELLLRLMGDDGAVVSPDRFIPAAERYGLMPMIDRWVVREALEIIETYLVDDVAAPLPTYAINISGTSVGDQTFCSYIRERLEHHKIPPSMVCFEITETSAISNLPRARVFIDELTELGCKFALDDFGNGMSSLVYLKQLPVTYIKIDGAFVRDMLDDPVDHAIVEMIARVGKLTGMVTIAEFAENDAIVAALREIGVDYAQGYAIGRPQPFKPHAPRPAHVEANGTVA